MDQILSRDSGRYDGTVPIIIDFIVPYLGYVGNLQFEVYFQSYKSTKRNLAQLI